MRSTQQQGNDNAVEITSITKDIGFIREEMVEIKSNIKEIKDNIKVGYVTKDEFAPIKNVVYGLVGLILTAVVVALISLVVRK